MSFQQRYSPLKENNDTIDENGITLAVVEKGLLPLGTLFRQHYSPFHNNDFRGYDDLANDTNNTKADNAGLEPFNSMQGMNSNTKVDDKGIGHFDIPINDEDGH